MSDAATCVPEPDRHTVPLVMRLHRKLAAVLLQHCALAVVCQIQKNLEEALPIGPDQRDRRIDIERETDVLFLQRGLHDNAKLLEERREIHTRGLIRHLAQVHRGDFFERQDQIAKGREILVHSQIWRERCAARKIGVGHGDGAADITDLMGNGAHEDAGSGQELVQA